jgi:hypothetical protein
MVRWLLQPSRGQLRCLSSALEVHLAADEDEAAERWYRENGLCLPDSTHAPFSAAALVLLRQSEKGYLAVIIMQSLRNSVVGASASSTNRNITSLVVPARIIRARNSKSTAPSPFDVVVMVTSGPVAGSGIVWKFRAGGSVGDQGERPEGTLADPIRAERTAADSFLRSL